MNMFPIKIGRPSPMIGVHWCTPVGWVPANDIPGAYFADGAWHNEQGDVAALVCFTNRSEGQEIDVDCDELGVATRFDWRVIDTVTVDLTDENHLVGDEYGDHGSS